MAESNFPLKVNLIGNATSLNTALTGASARLRQFSSRAKALGSSLTTSLTLPLALIGGASVKMALDFDKSMTKIKTLVGVASDEVDAMGGAVKRLAVDTGVNANDAADALFFITSAGLRGADAMAVLESSAKASAIGLGEVKTVADAVTSAVNAYGQANLSAESATDVLTAAVREGKLEADSLAQSMGKVLPVSSQLGVGFEEVGAALAAMSRTGTDAAMATTSLRGILSALLNPSSQANKELKNFHLEAGELRKQLREEGLLSVLKTLTETFGDNEEAAGKVFGNVRALTGVLDLMGNNVDTTEQIFARMSDTTGTLNTAFTELEDSLSFKFKKSLEAVRTSFTELGKTLAISVLPFIQKLAGFLTTTINKFNNLDTSTQNLILTVAGISATLGPALISIGLIGSGIAALMSPITLVIVGIAGLSFAIDNLIMPLDEFYLKAKAIFDKLRVHVQGSIMQFKLLKEFKFGELGLMPDMIDDAIDNINTKLEEDLGNIDGRTVTEKITSYFSDLKETFNSIGSGIGSSVASGIEKALKITVSATDIFDISSMNQSDINEKLKERLKILKRISDAVMFANQEAELAINKQAELAQRQVDAVTGAIGQIMGNIANSISNLFAGGEMNAKKFALGVLSILGDLAIQIGTLAVLANKAVTDMLIPGKGLAAGLALIAIGAAMKGISAKLQNDGVPLDGAFAKGGIISGPTVGLLGEYSGARHNPEVVAPLDKLKSMIGSNGSQNLSGEFVVRGQDLVVALQRAERNRNRFK